MAKEIFATATPGLTTLYALLFNATGAVWNGSGFVTPAANSRASYALSLTELLSKGVYTTDLPSGVTTPGRYSYVVFARAGGSPADTDARQGTGWYDLGADDLAGSAVVAASPTPTASAFRLSGLSGAAPTSRTFAVLASGSLQGQARPVYSYDGALGDLVVSPAFTAAPAAGVRVRFVGYR